MSEKMKNLWVRTASGAVLAVVMLGAIAWSQWSFGLLLAALLVAGMTEFYSLAEEQGNKPQRVVGLVAGLVLFALNFAFVSDDIQILGNARQAVDDIVGLIVENHRQPRQQRHDERARRQRVRQRERAAVLQPLADEAAEQHDTEQQQRE